MTDDISDLGATGVLDLCDPGSDKEKAAKLLWLVSICATLGLAIGRMVFSKKRVRKLKTAMSTKLKKTRSTWVFSAEITPVLKNKRTHESFARITMSSFAAICATLPLLIEV
jgi:hypothetical protein